MAPSSTAAETLATAGLPSAVLALAPRRRLGHHVRMKQLALLSLLLAALLLGGCVDAEVVAHLNPDGSGSFAIDVGYEQRSWPAFFGDPFGEWTQRRQLENFSDPGLGPWAEPEVVVVDGYRRFRTEVFFAHVDRVRILGWNDGRPFDALGFQYDSRKSTVRMTLGIMPELAKPLPLPTPRQAGMELSLSDNLMRAIREQIRPVIEGAHLRLAARLPGAVVRADAFDDWRGREAWIDADADRVALAMRERAGRLLNEATLNDGVLEVQWRPQEMSAAELDSFQQRLEAARVWWRSGAAETD